jgi:anti-anti-sigma regulatory factor
MQNAVPDSFPSVTRRPNSPSQPQPYTIVLQPGKGTGKVDTLELHQSIKQALEQATDAVIVDLIWVPSLNPHTMSVLIGGIQKAIAMGKSLSFQSVNSATRQILEAEQHRHHTAKFGVQQSSFAQDLEQFFDSRKQQTKRTSQFSNTDSKISPQFSQYPGLEDASQFAVLRTHQPA